MFFFSSLRFSKGGEYNNVSGEDWMMSSSFVPIYLYLMLLSFDLCLGEHFLVFKNTKWSVKMVNERSLLSLQK